jgi:long-chain acyl-CoA synthetase
MAMRWNNLGDLIDHGADLEREAIIDLVDPAHPRRYTHRQIDEMANGVAHYLVDNGYKPGTHIAIVSLNRAEYVACYFGIMRTGCIAVPVNIKVARDTMDFIMDDAQIALAFVDKGSRAMVRDDIPVIDFDDAGPAGFAATIKPAADFASVDGGQTMVGQMLYTSGSTGRPKGVPLSHHGQLWAISTRTNGASSPDQRYIIAQPLFHMNGLFAIKSIFSQNASVVLLPSFDTKAYIEAIATYKVTAATAVPTMWARVIKETELLKTHDITSISRLMLGSAPMTMGLWDRIKAALPNVVMTIGYGTTEAGPAVFGPHPKGIPTPPLALGYPIGDDNIKLVNGPENEGVLLMRNPSVLDHYHNLPQQSAKVLTDGWYYSGDVMRRDENGFYYFVGRADDMFVCSGENVYPGEVEKLLERHPDVQQAVVVPLPDEERSQVPVAFIVTRAGAVPSFDDIRRFTIANGPAYQHPRRVAFIQEMPWAGTNKIDRKALIDRARSLEASHCWSA